MKSLKNNNLLKTELKDDFFLLFAVLINSLGIALGTKANVGSTVWTAAFVNFSYLTHISVGTAAGILSVAMFLVSKIIARDFKIKGSVGTLAMCVVLSFMVNFYLFCMGSSPFGATKINPLGNMLTNYIFATIGILITAFSVAIEIRVNKYYLALDDYLKNLRKHVFSGHTGKASIGSFLTGTLIAVISGLIYFKGNILKISDFWYVITLVTVVAFGFIVEMFLKLLNRLFGEK